MEKHPQPPPQFPVVPIPTATMSANMVAVVHSPGNDGIQLQVAELRESGVERVGEKPTSAIFELGRFMLTPRALRQLADSVAAAVKSYEQHVGPLPTHEAFIVRAALPGLLQPPPQGG